MPSCGPPLPWACVYRDAYIAASGCIAGEDITPLESAQSLARLAVEMQRLCATLRGPDGGPVVMRIGLHCGPVVGGVVGGSMLRYNLFGSPMDAVTQVWEGACLSSLGRVAERVSL